jgi:hypothetical protein
MSESEYSLSYVQMQLFRRIAQSERLFRIDEKMGASLALWKHGLLDCFWFRIDDCGPSGVVYYGLPLVRLSDTGRRFLEKLGVE